MNGSHVPGLLQHRVRVWLGELELAEGAIGRLTHHEMLPRGVNVTEAALQRVGIAKRRGIAVTLTTIPLDVYGPIRSATPLRFKSLSRRAAGCATEIAPWLRCEANPNPTGGRKIGRGPRGCH